MPNWSNTTRTMFLLCFETRVYAARGLDVIAYVEAYMEVLTALGDAENDLYSANFADYAGGGGMKVGILLCTDDTYSMCASVGA